MDWNTASAALSERLDSKHVKARRQGGGQVSYIEGWHAIAEMNRVFGFGAWDRETMDIRLLGEPREVEGKLKVDYMARVRVTVTLEDGRSVTRDGCGFGQGIDRDVGQAHESALKEAETDAMKRAMMTFGNPFGLALYDKSRENVAPPERANGSAAKPGPNASAPKAQAPVLEQRQAQPPVSAERSPAFTEADIRGVIARLSAAETLPALQDAWIHAGGMQKIHAVLAAKDARKAALTASAQPAGDRWPGDAAQRPLVDDHLPY